MKRFAALVLLLVAGTLPAFAADAVVTLTLDGRPIDKHGGIAVMHAGTVFVDAIDMTKTFNGLISMRTGGSATITIGGSTGAFVPGSTTAVVNGVKARIPAPFMRGGDLFVPLNFFITRLTRAKVRIDAARRRADILVNANPMS
jgi:hypothetical protein